MRFSAVAASGAARHGGGETLGGRWEAGARPGRDGEPRVSAVDGPADGDDLCLVLQLPEAVLCGVLDLLDGRSLLRAGAVCRTLRRAVWDAPDGSALHRWRRLCEEELGEAVCGHHAVFEECVRDQEAQEQAEAQGRECEAGPDGPRLFGSTPAWEEGECGKGRRCAQSQAGRISGWGPWSGATGWGSMRWEDERPLRSQEHGHEQAQGLKRGGPERQAVQCGGTGFRAQTLPAHTPGLSGARFWGHLWGSLLLGSSRSGEGAQRGRGKLTAHWWPMGQTLILSSASTSGAVGQLPSQEQGLPAGPQEGHAPEGDALAPASTGATSGAASEQWLGGAPPLASPAFLESLSRTGHTSTQVGTWQVVVGGLTKAGTAVMDVLVIDSATLRMWQPHLTCANGGPPPRPRFRQTVAVIRRPQSTTLQHHGLHQQRRSTSAGAGSSKLGSTGAACGSMASQEDTFVLFMFGGYTLEGTVYGPEDAYTLTLSADGKRGEWHKVACSGAAPSGRFHHTMTAFDGGRQILVFGGEGPDVNDTLTAAEQEEAALARAREQSQTASLGEGREEEGEGEGAREKLGKAHMKEEPTAPSCAVSVVVYVMDCLTFTWQRVVTFGPGPGFRLLHVSTLHRCRRSGRERFVVVGGFSRAQGAVHAEEAPTVQELQSLRPYVLDLRTYQWHVGPLPQGGEDALPKSRHRACYCQIGHGRMLLMEGARGSTRNYLDDAHLLDLNTLQWSMVDVKGRPSDGPSAGQSLESCIVVGGCIIGTLGIKVTPRLDVLVLGDWPEHVVAYAGRRRQGANSRAGGLLPEWTPGVPLQTEENRLLVIGAAAGPAGVAPAHVKKADGVAVHAFGQASKKQRGQGWVAPQEDGDRKVGLATVDGGAGHKEGSAVGRDADVSDELTLNLVAKINQVRSTLQGGSDGGPK